MKAHKQHDGSLAITLTDHEDYAKLLALLTLGEIYCGKDPQVERASKVFRELCEFLETAWESQPMKGPPELRLITPPKN